MIFICLISALVALVLYFRQVYSRFSRYGVKHAPPIPPLGTIWRPVLRIQHLAYDFIRDYNAFPNERFVGKYEFLTPIVLIRDPELIKKITVKDYEYFLDHRTISSAQTDPLFGKNMFALKGQEWKDMRSTVSPAFTRAKMKMMLPFMVEVGDQMILALKNQINASSTKYVDLDVLDLTTRYSNDVIASCAFGLKVDSYNNRENQFYVMNRNINSFSFKQSLIVLLFASFPKLLTKLNLTVFTNDDKYLIHKLVKDTIELREVHNIIRHDLIHLLMEAKKGTLSHENDAVKDADAGFAVVEESSVGKRVIRREWTDDDLFSQPLVFLVAGYELGASLMSLLLHEVAINPGVQDKLYREIMDSERSGGKFDLNAVQEMTYLDMVVSEFLRINSGSYAIDRVCVKDYNLGKPNPEATEDYIIRKGEGVHIPVSAIHLDPQHYANPSKFDPERFSEENKRNIKPFTYFPFGLGPRSCIASRFALFEVKVMVYMLLREIEISPCEKTRIDSKLSPRTTKQRFEGGQWLRFKLRE